MTYKTHGLLNEIVKNSSMSVCETFHYFKDISPLKIQLLQPEKYRNTVTITDNDYVYFILLM